MMLLVIKRKTKKGDSNPKEQKNKARRKAEIWKAISTHTTQDRKEKPSPYTIQVQTHARLKNGMRGELKVIIMDEYLLCNALNREISPPSSLPTALICLLMAWQISLPAAICAFSPSKPPRVARSMKDTQRREYTASTCVCVARG